MLRSRNLNSNEVTDTLPRLYKLTPEKIDEVIRDLELIKRGGSVKFAVDPHEITEFCFPVNPDNTGPVDVDTIADDQAAFDEIFFRRKSQPLLLPDYARELQGNLSYLERHLSDAYNKAAILQQLIKEGRLDELLNRTRKIKPEDIAEDYFGVLLAVARGLFSVGIERFRTIFHQRLVTIGPRPRVDKDIEPLRAIFGSYSETPVRRDIYTKLEAAMVQPAQTAADKEKRKRSLLVDAAAIDRTLYLNRELANAYDKKLLSIRYVILYFSSATRTEKIFELDSVQAALPHIDGTSYPIWRTRRQVFSYVVHRSRGEDRSVRIDQTIANLTVVKEILSELQKLRMFQCENCLLKRRTPGECELIDFCQNVVEVTQHIQKTRGQIENWGLINSLGEDYNRLLKIKANVGEDSKQLDSCLELFRQVCESGVKDIALDKMHQKQQWIRVNSEAANLFKEGFVLGRGRPKPLTFRSKRDSITGIDQILPSKPKLSSPQYTRILKFILEYCHNPSPDSFKLLENGYREYRELDSGREMRDPEQELINCYLYLAFGTGGEDIKPYSQAKKLVETMASSSDEENPVEREYLYMLVWAARRLGRFRESREFADAAIRRWPDDGRFYHGRSLNTFSWLVHQRHGNQSPYTISEAIADAERAVELYQKSAREYRELITVNHNNLAYFYAMMTEINSISFAESQDKLRHAREHLELLKKRRKKTSWLPDHPEFHHTEAYIEYREFVIESLNKDYAFLMSKLQNAKIEIDKAIEGYNDGPGYDDLRNQIMRAIDRYLYSTTH